MTDQNFAVERAWERELERRGDTPAAEKRAEDDWFRRWEKASPDERRRMRFEES